MMFYPRTTKKKKYILFTWYNTLNNLSTVKALRSVLQLALERRSQPFLAILVSIAVRCSADGITHLNEVIYKTT